MAVLGGRRPTLADIARELGISRYYKRPYAWVGRPFQTLFNMDPKATVFPQLLASTLSAAVGPQKPAAPNWEAIQVVAPKAAARPRP